MLIFATSDKGGTGRSVTSSNVALPQRAAGQRRLLPRLRLRLADRRARSSTSRRWCTAPPHGGLHSYLHGAVADPHRVEIWQESDRTSLRGRPPGAGRLVLLPGDSGGGEFPITREKIDRCSRLFLQLEEEFDLCLVDLSAGRSYATEMVLAATAQRGAAQRPHPLAGLPPVDPPARPRRVRPGLRRAGHPRHRRPARPRPPRSWPRRCASSARPWSTPTRPSSRACAPSQVAWLRDCDRDLAELASGHKVGRTLLLATDPARPGPAVA